MTPPRPEPKPRRVTVGVFDSGFGGLTVLRELLAQIPGAHFVYLGDTARLPYGAKSKATVTRYAVEAARFLVRRGAGLLVIACNTATALAMEEIQAAVAVPVIGVIEPGAAAVADACHAPHASSDAPFAEPEAMTYPMSSTAQQRPAQILVLATAATVQSHAYRDTCARLGLQATEKACPLLVPLVEEGWIDHPVTRDVLRIYLSEALNVHHGLRVDKPAAILLGCTHYPLLAPAIRTTLSTLGSTAPVIDSAQATARAVQQRIAALVPLQAASTDPSTFECFATDSVDKFARLGALFLGRPMPQIDLLQLEE